MVAENAVAESEVKSVAEESAEAMGGGSGGGSGGSGGRGSRDRQNTCSRIS